MNARGGAIALGLGALMLPTLAGCGHRGAEATAAASTAPKIVIVDVAPVERRAVDRTVDVVGELKGWDDVTIGAKREGRVVKIRYDMGDRVAPGALLVELETTDAQLAVEQAERHLQVDLAKLGLTEPPKANFDIGTIPSVVQAKVALDRAKQNLARERSLQQRNAGAYQDFQNAENDERSSEAALGTAILNARSALASAQSTKVAIDIAKHDLKEMSIAAPVPSVQAEAANAGRTAPTTYAVAKRMVHEGQIVKQGDPVFQLVIENPLRLWVKVAERYSAEIKVGQEVRIEGATARAPVQGKVTRINPSVEHDGRFYQVEALVPNDAGLLRPGGFAKASIVTDRNARATVVPIESVVKYAGVTKLFVVADNKARSIEVETGLEGPGWTEVVAKSPIPDNAQVVTTGQSQLAEGTPVLVRAPAPAPGR